jgi:3-hydroxyacyl-CoA dehydrogenase/enoyl-CoA hydratase/3-hydroxybutyryl-CoA epimerase
MRKIRVAAQAAAADAWETHAAEAVIDRMLDEFDRPGRLEGRGFYEYDAEGMRTGLWSGLREAFPPVEDPASLSLHDLEERLMFIEAIEAVRCYEEGVIESVADANIGSIMGIGFPAWSGGVLQFINGYAGGLQGFVDRAHELADQYGERFAPPASLVERAARGERFSDEVLTAS